MNVAAQLLSVGSPDAIAVSAGPTSLTYRELRTQVNRIAAWLRARGCRKQDRIGLWSENSPFFVAGYLAVLRAGLVAVPFQTDSTPETLRKILTEAGIEVLLVSRRYLAQLRQWLADLPVELLAEADLNSSEGGIECEFPAVEPKRDLAALMFTSGSTGQPKGVMVTHQNIACNTADIVGYMGLSPADRAMVVLPFHYCFGLSVLHSHLAAGATVVLNNQFLYPEKMLQAMQAMGCTGLAGVPSTFQILLRKSRFKEMQFPHLRWFQQAGGKLPNPFIKEILTAFPTVRFYLMYGQTEATARLSYLPPERLADKLGSIGRGLPSTRLEVLRTNGTPVEAGSDEVGEIVASGDNITLGYWQDPQETSRYFRNGRLYTGDLARVDEDGFVYVVEREREMIKCGGNRVSAKEIEEVIAEVPDVVEVAVVGMPHELLGEAGVAFVSPAREGAVSASDLLDHCRRRLPPFKIPVNFLLLSRLPHGSNGKVLKQQLREIIRTGVPEEVTPEPARGLARHEPVLSRSGREECG